MAPFRVGETTDPVLAPGRVRSSLERLRTPQYRVQVDYPPVVRPDPPVVRPDTRYTAPASHRQHAASVEGKHLYTLTVYKVGQCEMPGPLVFRTSAPDAWQTLFFYLVVIRGHGKTLVINTGLPDNLDPLNKVWTEMAGPRCAVTRETDQRTLTVLARIGLDPATVDYVLVSPFKAYLVANLHLFSRATVCVSRHGWLEHYLARRYPSPTPDHWLSPTTCWIAWSAARRIRCGCSKTTTRSSPASRRSGSAPTILRRWRLSSAPRRATSSSRIAA